VVCVRDPNPDHAQGTRCGVYVAATNGVAYAALEVGVTYKLAMDTRNVRGAQQVIFYGVL
jgi:hypothetical protein